MMFEFLRERYGVSTGFGKTRNERAANRAWRERYGSSIREVRLLRGMTQGQLAKEIGVDITSISAIERGEAVPNLAMLDAMADLLEAPLDLLVGKMSVWEASEHDLFFINEPPSTPHLRELTPEQDAELRAREDEIRRLRGEDPATSLPAALADQVGDLRRELIEVGDTAHDALALAQRLEAELKRLGSVRDAS